MFRYTLFVFGNTICGTVDIAVHEKLNDGGLKELCRANGSDCGGTTVDKKFLAFLCSLFGKDVISTLKTDDPESFMRLTRSFEAQKRKFCLSTLHKKISIDLPSIALNELCEQYHGKSVITIINESESKEYVTFKHGHLKIRGHFFQSFYEETLDKLHLLLTNTFADPRVRDVKNIILVGGFAESEIVQQKVKEWFEEMNVMLPEEASLAVLKGAVLFGHKKTQVVERVVKFTYGISGMVPFKDSKHRMNQVEIIDGQSYATNIFHVLIKQNTGMKIGSEILLEVSTITPFQRYIRIVLFLSKSNETVYTDEEECFESGHTLVQITTPKKARQKLTLGFSFGETEIAIRKVEPSSRTSPQVAQTDDGEEESVHFDIFEPLLIEN